MFHGTFVVVWPGETTEMTPPQVHMSRHVVLSAGLLPTVTVGEPGVQGAVVTGIQGCGVSTPMAADVAAATCGLLNVVHMPNGIIFFMGTLSSIVAAGRLPALVRFSGVMVKVLGIVPKLHCIEAPFVTS
jgi:hypothetical protein